MLVGEPIGRGTCAFVHRGILVSESGLRRNVALKLFSPGGDEDVASFAFFADHAQRLAQVHHPNVVALYEAGVHQGAPFLVTELVTGVSLTELASRFSERRARLPLDVALFIACEIGSALEGARTARGFDGVALGILHLGLAPSDVLLSWRGEVKVTDFELSNAKPVSSAIRSLRDLSGRIQFMPPEIASGDAGDARSDVFSLGVVLRELLVGPRFPRGLNSSEASRLAREGYVHPVCFRPDLAPELTTVLQRALEIDPDERYAHAGALTYELRRIALAMGVGDGRWFLRRLLQRELDEETSEVTRQISSLPPPDER